MNEFLSMKMLISPIATFLLAAVSSVANAHQASDTTIAITGHTVGCTPFISKIHLSVSDLSVLESVSFEVVPKPGSVTRPISALYRKKYLADRGYVSALAGKITVPAFGLYQAYNNQVNLVCFFADGSSKPLTTLVSAAPFDDACNFDAPVVHQARTTTTALSYDFILAASACSEYSPVILDTDGAVRWVGIAGVREYYTAFFNNGVYLANGTKLLRMELDGTVRVVADYASAGVVGFHHNIDIGKRGLILDVNSDKYIASVHLEVDAITGRILKKWNLAKIISAAMVAGGDNPSEFVREANGHYGFQAYGDWTHDNAVTYRPSDNSIIISSRENFVICIDYDTSAIKWILGDTAKRWYQFPSLRKFALVAPPGTTAPVGQHSVSITKDNNLLLFDNGQRSAHQYPTGPNRSYSAPRKYALNLAANVATEVWNFTNNQSIRSRFRSSVYEDAASNYLVTYARAENPNRSLRAEILGLTPAGEKVFDYSYPTSTDYNEAYRALPIHLEQLRFGPRAAVSASNNAAAEIHRDWSR